LKTAASEAHIVCLRFLTISLNAFSVVSSLDVLALTVQSEKIRNFEQFFRNIVFLEGKMKGRRATRLFLRRSFIFE
jgi:hypothetical protein